MSNGRREVRRRAGRVALAAAVAVAFAADGHSRSSTAGVRCTARVVNGSGGVVVCGARAFATRDGRSWRAITPPAGGAPIHDIATLGPRRLWLVTNDCAAARAFVWRTGDGGRTWARARVGATNCAAGSRLALAFADRRHGWLARVFLNGNTQELERTADGGVRWRAVGMLPFVGSLVFRTRRHGWIGMSDFARPQQLAVTEDGGRTWRRRILRSPAGWGGARLFPDRPTFFGARGVVPVTVVRGRETAVAFYATRDGGRTWRLRTVRPVAWQGVRFQNPFVRYVPTSVATPSTWWVVAGRTRATVQVTEDGGRQWRTVRPRGLTWSRYAAVSAADGRHAWISGLGVYATADEGRSWRRLNVP